ncbi:MAG: NADH-quinone oxidoreductase subunit NuoK [Thermodesulfovibrionia bacterium]|nr:NADH-quinone oxidoreductase subunit NuoK [Thermodesulfovibrionia bacterium]
MVPLSWYTVLSAVVFSIGVLGFLIRRNVIIMLISIEIMLNAANISLAAFSHYTQDMRGQIFVFFVIAVAAAEVAIGLAIIIALFRNKPTLNVDELNIMRW